MLFLSLQAKHSKIEYKGIYVDMGICSSLLYGKKKILHFWVGHKLLLISTPLYTFKKNTAQLQVLNIKSCFNFMKFLFEIFAKAA